METVYGIGNPLIDVIVNITDDELKRLGLFKGTMNLINLEKRLELTEFIKTKKDPSFSCGGSCPNTIITLSSLGIGTTLAGKIGNDEYGSIYRERLTSLKVHDNLAVSDSNVTGSSIILITPDSERTMNTYLGANRDFCPDDVIEKEVASAGFFHFTGYMWDTQNQMEAIRKALAIAKRNNTVVSFDIADPFAVGRYHDSFLELIRENCDIVFANKEEARMLFDNYDPYECCKTMGKLCETAVVKNGKKGSFISHKRTIYEIPVQGPSTPVDTTGAGDTYAAGFLYGLCHGMDIERSGSVASCLAGQIIKQVGAQFPAERIPDLMKMISVF
ncbi:MAG: adenosine kinase [Spirochaetales bacterium]|nr:adenosine kinase [Spirochaetales bacterium]